METLTGAGKNRDYLLVQIALVSHQKVQRVLKLEQGVEVVVAEEDGQLARLQALQPQRWNLRCKIRTVKLLSAADPFLYHSRSCSMHPSSTGRIQVFCLEAVSAVGQIWVRYQ